MRRWCFALLGFAAVALGVGRADSLWDRRDPRYAFLFQDNRARSIGDTLTVTISETTVTNEQDARNTNRTTRGSGSITFFDRFRTPATAGNGGGGGGAAGQTLFQTPTQQTASNFAGTSQNTTNRVFTDRLAVTVVDVLPNGNLVVEGFRSRVVQGEERVLRITGIVRPADVQVGNIVPSGSIANFRISYLGRGPTTNVTKPGIVTRVANAFRLF
jgi:flagellar L-ring protein precursor FlgH